MEKDNLNTCLLLYILLAVASLTLLISSFSSKQKQILDISFEIKEVTIRELQKKTHPKKANLVRKNLTSNQKIKVGFIDTGVLNYDAVDFHNVSVREMFEQPEEELHAHTTLRVFIQNLSTMMDVSNVEIVYCHINKNNQYDFSQCFEYFDQNNMDYINISITSQTLTDTDIVYLKRITDSGTIISVAAGNDRSLVPKTSMCALDIKNKVCVGGVDQTLLTNTGSSFGDEVNVYDFFCTNFIHQGSAFNQCGTSYSSPLFLSRLISQNFKGQNFDFEQNIYLVSGVNEWDISKKSTTLATANGN